MPPAPKARLPARPQTAASVLPCPLCCCGAGPACRPSRVSSSTLIFCVLCVCSNWTPIVSLGLQFVFWTGLVSQRDGQDIRSTLVLCLEGVRCTLGCMARNVVRDHTTATVPGRRRRNENKTPYLAQATIHNNARPVHTRNVLQTGLCLRVWRGQQWKVSSSLRLKAVCPLQ